MKKKTKADSELKRWCAMLEKGAVQPDQVPHGWHTMAEIAEESGKSIVTTSHRIRKYMKDGLVERKDFRIQLEQRIRPVPHYRLK